MSTFEVLPHRLPATNNMGALVAYIVPPPAHPPSGGPTDLYGQKHPPPPHHWDTVHYSIYHTPHMIHLSSITNLMHTGRLPRISCNVSQHWSGWLRDRVRYPCPNRSETRQHAVKEVQVYWGLTPQQQPGSRSKRSGQWRNAAGVHSDHTWDAGVSHRGGLRAHHG